MFRRWALLPLFLLVSCSYMQKMLEDKSYNVQNIKHEEMALIFSHNINGETHPCGCHQFPRGGLAQMAGLFHQIKNERPLIFVDTGDTFFPSPVVPDSTRASLTLTAHTVAETLDLLGLQYFVPGDQDFALGIEFLQEIAQKHRFQFLISNLNDPKTIKHKEWVKLQGGPHRFYLVGLVDPQVINPKYARYFTSIDKGLERAIEQITEDGYEAQNAFHRLIVLSHSGLSADRNLAKKYPQINWIIGAHTNSFTQVPQKQGDTTIVQVLSRNHFAGEIRLALNKDRKGDQFIMHEVKEELDAIIKPNPVSQLISDYKIKLTEIQKTEQSRFYDHDYSAIPITTSTSCIDCHSDQAHKWQTTPHSLAYLTLVNAGQPYDLSCIGCHSVGANDPRGFKTAQDMIRLDPERAEEVLATLGKDEMQTRYWQEMREAFKDIGTIKDLSPQVIQLNVKKWQDLDERFGVTHNFANVQCMNCHDQHPDHPFHIGQEAPPTKDERYANIKNRCLTCHNTAQSPSWYQKDERGLAGKLDEDHFQKMYHKIACPSLSESE